MIHTANRLVDIKEYYFSKKLREVHELSKNNPIINLGIGSPDLQPPEKVIQAISESVKMPNAHKYQSYQGLASFREAIANFYSTHFSVNLNPSTEILPLMGSKEGIMHISMAYLNPGDTVLIPNPGYPTYQSVSKLVGAKIQYYNLDESNDWQPNFESLEKQNLNHVKLMWVNYPHMPTGASANENLFQNLVAFGKKHDILIVNDNPYSFILNDSPKSILSIPGSKDICLELNSLSKTFNMAGWRVGMVIGHESFIKNILKVKSNMDSGMFYGIQQGAIKALYETTSWFKQINDIYESRRNIIWEMAEILGCKYRKNATGLFVWAKLPEKYKSSEAFVDDILKEKHIFITPGTVFGTKGEGYIRFSLCAPNEVLKTALERLR